MTNQPLQTPSGAIITMSDYSVGWIAVHLDRNSARPLDTVELLRVAIEMIENEYREKNALRFDGKQPFIVEDVIVDVQNGIVTVYFNWNNME